MTPLVTFMGPEIIIVFFFLIGIASFALTIWSVIEIASKPFVNEKDKVLWLIIVLLLGGIGPLIYLTQRKKLLAKYNEQLELPDLDGHQPRQQQPLPRGTSDEDYV